MEAPLLTILALTFGMAVLGHLALAFGADSRPGFDRLEPDR